MGITSLRHATDAQYMGYALRVIIKDLWMWKTSGEMGKNCLRALDRKRIDCAQRRVFHAFPSTFRLFPHGYVDNPGFPAPGKYFSQQLFAKANGENFRREP